MLEHRALRFVVEALILVAVAAAVTVADLRWPVIVGVMALTWAVVSVLEWAFLQGESHYASGLPPRYYVPPLALPSANQIEERHAPSAQPPPTLEPAEQPPLDEELSLEPDPVEEPVDGMAQEPPAPVTAQNVAVERAPELPPVEELEPELDYKLLAAELRTPRHGGSSWFDSELPGGRDNADLFLAALAELEDEWTQAAAATAPAEPELPGETELQARPVGRRLLPGRPRRGG